MRKCLTGTRSTRGFEMRRVVPVLGVVVLAVVSSCGGSSPNGAGSTSTAVRAGVQGTATTAPTVTPTAAAGAATTGPPSTGPAVAELSADPDLDPATRARVHVVAMDQAAGAVDLFVDGALAMNGGQAQVNVSPGYVTAYQYLAPGTHTIAVAPTGKGLAQATTAPLDVPMVAGHRYLVAFPAQAAAGSVKPLLIDETEAAAKLGATPKDSVIITLNDLAGTTGLSYEWAGKIVNDDIKLGDFGTGIVPAGDGHVTVTAKGATDTVVMDEDNYVAPGNSDFGLFGPDATSSSFGVVDSASTMELNLVESLHAYDAQNLLPGTSDFPSFTTLVGAIEKAGMTDLYTGGATLLFLPPTDKAFAAMPQADREALLADPAALAAMLRSHTVAAYVPRGSLAKTPGGTFDRTFTTLSGDTIMIGADYTVNGGGGGGGSYWLANGTQVHPVDTVTFPPAS